VAVADKLFDSGWYDTYPVFIVFGFRGYPDPHNLTSWLDQPYQALILIGDLVIGHYQDRAVWGMLLHVVYTMCERETDLSVKFDVWRFMLRFHNCDRVAKSPLSSTINLKHVDAKERVLCWSGWIKEVKNEQERGRYAG